MIREDFKNWMIENKGYDVNTANTRIGNCSTIEQAYGDLDEHYQKDRLNQLFNLLKYSKQDEREEKKPIEPLEIEGIVYDGLATLRQGLRRYCEFKLHLDSISENTECIVSNEVFKIKDNNLSSSTELSNTIQNTLILLPIKDLSKKTFVIGGYQRGYKWSKKEILELLNDIANYNESDGLYCLQPLILKPLSDVKQKINIGESYSSIFTKNEVVDGQQRSTTLYLLLKYLYFKDDISSDYLFEIDFQTRERSGVFLKEHLHSIFEFNAENITEKELSDKDYNDLKTVNLLWKSFIEKYKEFNNVDVYHFFVVSTYLKRWIEIYLSDDLHRKKFIEKVLENVKVIWYSLDHSQKDDEIINVFLNNNKGKIGLTSSELIKALFILDIINNEPESISNLKINQFALEWDSVEKQLQDDRFWYFIQSNENEYKEGTRIDFLFDLILKKPSKSDSFFAYRYFEKLFNAQKSILKSWDEIIQLFYKLLNWYEDSEIFHFVGFLTNSNIKKLDKLLQDYKGKTKEELKAELKKDIKNYFYSHKDKTEEGKEFFICSVNNLHYQKYYSKTLKVLLLYNVLYYIDNMAGHKFPFELFVKEQWSIEHIIPQNPKDIEDIGVFAQWFEDIVSYGDVDISDDFIIKIKSFSSIEELRKDKLFKSLIDKIVQETEDVTHDLNNLLLLDRNTNSSLGNKLFDVKRSKIVQFDKDGYNDKGKPVFIPYETLNAFNKTFSKEINIKNWTKEDGDNYVAAIQKRLIDFIPPTNN